MAFLSHKVIGGAWKLLSLREPALGSEARARGEGSSEPRTAELREVYEVVRGGDVLQRLRGLRLA